LAAVATTATGTTATFGIPAATTLAGTFAFGASALRAGAGGGLALLRGATAG
jgi:hypothetical protein